MSAINVGNLLPKSLTSLTMSTQFIVSQGSMSAIYAIKVFLPKQISPDILKNHTQIPHAASIFLEIRKRQV